MEKNYTIAVDEMHLADFDNMARQIKESGGMIKAQMREIGVFTVVLDSANEAKIRQLPGIAAIEPEGVVSIPPPDSDIQ